VPKVYANPHEGPAALEVDEPASTRRDYVLIAVCALVALIAGHIGGGVSGSQSWPQLLAVAATMLVAVIVAASVLRLATLAAVHQDIARQVAVSDALSSEIYGRLEDRFPGVAERAEEIAPGSLFSKATGSPTGAPKKRVT
jgi:hypothetical protein